MLIVQIEVDHTPVQKIKKLGLGRKVPKPLFLSNNIIMCDTCVYMTGGKLSCVEVLSRKVWQV